MNHHSNGPAIEVQDLTKHYKELEAVAGVSFQVAPGETFGFLGPNGAGKSTTIDMLCTLVRPTAGSAHVAGFNVITHQTQVRRQIGLVFQDPTLDDYLTAHENLEFHAELYGVSRDVRDERIRRVMEMVGLWDRRSDVVRVFSGGMKRRLEIARGLLHSPRVLFLDEPTVGLDPQTRSHIWNYINALKQQESTTMFLTTHYMDEAENCDRIAIIDQGKIVAMDTPEALKAGVGDDRVELRTPETEAAVAALRTRFDLDPEIQGNTVIARVPKGEEFVPRLFSELTVRIDAVTVVRPTLDDVFMNYTGHTIRDAESSSTDRARNNPFMRRHMRR